MMRPVKTQKRPPNPLGDRLRAVCRILGQGTELYLSQLADIAGVNRSSLKNAAGRDSLSHDLAAPIARLFLDPEQASIHWLRTGEGEPPKTPKKALIRLTEPRSGEKAGGVGTPVALERRMRAERAGHAFEQSIEEGELYLGNEGGWELYDVLIDVAGVLADHGAPNGDILAYAKLLKSELKPRR